VTHDRYFLDNAAEWISNSTAAADSWKGNYSSWLDQKQERLAQEDATETAAKKRSRKSSSGCAPARRAYDEE